MRIYSKWLLDLELTDLNGLPVLEICNCRVQCQTQFQCDQFSFNEVSFMKIHILYHAISIKIFAMKYILFRDFTWSNQLEKQEKKTKEKDLLTSGKEVFYPRSKCRTYSWINDWV